MFIKTRGGCMRPLIKSGQIVYIKKNKNFSVGDIVLYNMSGEKYLHRVIKITGKEIIVCDDTNITSPVRINSDNVEGVFETFFSGYIGLIYNKIVSTFFLLFRKIRNWRA